MSLQDILSNLYSSITSDKITERKKCTESLKEYLSGSGLPSVLTENQRKNTGISWKSLFVRVHELILKEVEKLDSGKGVSTHDAVKVQCSSLLISVISGANKAKCYVATEKILECCQEAFKSNKMMRHFGETYLNVVFKHVLLVPYYLNMFSPYEWADLLESSLELQENPTADMSTVVKLVCCVLEESTKRCQVTLAVRDNLQSIGGCFLLLNDIQRQHHTQENLLRIGICVLSTVGAESRLAACIFTESILSGVVKFYEQSVDITSKKKKFLFKFLSLCVTIHHPGPSSKQSLAGNNTTWLQAFHNIQQIVRTEASLLTSSIKRLNNQQSVEICPQYLALAVKVYHQVFNSHQSSLMDVDEPHNPPKRIKYEYNEKTYTTLLESINSNNCYPWVCIVAHYFKTHYHSLSGQDIQDTLCLVASLLHNETFSHLTKSLQLLDSVATVCKCLATCDFKMTPECSEQLLSIWKTCVRKSTEKALFDKCHSVLQSVLRIHSLDTPLESLLKLYCEQNIPGQHSHMALKTLHNLLDCYNHKICDKSKRLILAQWILNVCMDSSQRLHLVANVLFLTTINESYLSPKICSTNSASDILDQIYGDIQFVILKSDFENGLLHEENCEKRNSHLKSKSVVIFSEVADFILNHLYEKHIIANSSEMTLSLKGVSLLLKYISLFERNEEFGVYSVILTRLRDELPAIMGNLPPHIKRLPQMTNDSKDILQLLSSLYNKKDYTRNIFEIICSATTKEVVESFCLLLNDSDETDLNDSMELMNEDMDHVEESEGSLKCAVLNILCNFCSCNTSFTNQLIAFILGRDMYDFSSLTDFNTAAGLLSFLVEEFDKDSIPISNFLEVLQEMCKKQYRDNECSFKILCLLYGILENVHTHGNKSNKENCGIMLNSFLMRSNNKFYTARTMGQVMKCLTWIQIQPDINEWGSCMNVDILQYLSNTIHCNRLYGCVCLSRTIKCAPISKFNSMVAALPDVFLINERDLSETLISDESANRTSTVLHCLVCIAFSSSIWDKRAIAELIKIAHKKRLNPILVGRVFGCLGKHFGMDSFQRLLVDNLPYLVYCWLSDGLSLADFPYYLLLCQTKEEFFDKYLTVLLPYDMLWSVSVECSEVLQILVVNASKSKEAILKECLPHTLSLILPYILDNKSTTNCKWSPSSKLMSSAKNIYAAMCKAFKEDTVVGCTITECSVQVLSALTSYVCDEDSLRNDLGWSGAIPHVEGPILNSLEYTIILNWLNEKLQMELLLHLCCNVPSAIQQLLLHLWENIRAQHSLERKLLSLCQYWTFCDALPLPTKLNTFMCQFIIQTLLHLIDEYSHVEDMYYVSVAACNILYSFLKKLLPDLSPIVSKMLSSIVYCVSKAITKNVKIKESALSVLVYLVVDMNGVLPGIHLLDPLPDEEHFSKLNSVLKSLNSRKSGNLRLHIENFIRGGVTGRFEGLKLLQERLSSCQNELVEMFRQLKECRGFYEDCEDSVLHQLACALIHIANNKEDMRCCVEALRCLGVLGVSDYQTYTIQPPPDFQRILELDPVHLLALHALDLLPSMYLSPQPDVCKAVAATLISLLRFKESVIALDILATEDDRSLDFKEFLLPFMASKKSWPAVKMKLDNRTFDSLLNSRYIWSSDVTNRTHFQWIVELTTGIISSFSAQQCFLADFIAICKLSQNFSEKIAPALIGLVFSHGTEHQIKSFISKIQELFDSHYAATFQPNLRLTSAQQLAKDIMPKQSIECLLEMVKFAFVQKKHYSSSTSSSSPIGLFELDLLPCAWAACSVGHHLAAIYFAEVWCMTKLDQNLPSSPEKITELPKGNEILSIMRKSYECLCDDAAMTGCGSAHLLDTSQRREHYLRSGSYSDALLMHDCDITTHSNEAFKPTLVPELSFAQSLQTAGLYHLAGNYLNSKQSSPDLDAMKYECAWKLGDWSLQTDTSRTSARNREQSLTNMKAHNLWPAHHYATLRNAITKNVETLGGLVYNNLKDARHYVAVSCLQNSMESSQSVYKLCGKLQILHELECFVQARQKYGHSDDILDLHSFLSSWNVDLLPPTPSFSLLEDILTQRCVILKNLFMQQQAVDSELTIPVVELLLQYADVAFSEKSPTSGVRWISTARHLVEIDNNKSEDSGKSSRVRGLVALAEGTAAWKSGHLLVGQHLLKTFINNESNQKDSQLYAKALRLYGSWMVESRSESALDILGKYLTKSLQVLGSRGDSKERIKTYITIAKFCDGEYKQMEAYMKSAAFVNKIKCMEQCKVKATTLRENHDKVSLTKDEKKAMIFNDGQSRIDQIEIANTKTERNHYLHLAIKYYLSTLIEGEAIDLCIFRVISLWLDNPTLDAISSANKSLAQYLKEIPSRKLLPVISQLAPRLNSIDPQPYHKIIYNLIERCLFDHPHHVLPILLALKNSYKDVEYTDSRTTLSQIKSTNDAYVVTAKHLLDGVIKKANPSIVNIVKETEQLSLALISLANFKVNNSKSSDQLVPKTEPLKKIKNLMNVLVPTVTIPVRADCNYKDVPTVVSFTDRFQLVGGINLPKKMSCLGSDGVHRSMLLKGEDDIRQDGVMQQVFVIVNQLLADHKHRSTRKMQIRTYKVVPLSRRSGVIEWCDGTVPLSRLLIGANGSSGLHAAMRPRDMTAKEARTLMNDNRMASNDEKLKVFKKILSKLKPVFHHFFFQNFVIPSIWYERKLAYTQSVATSSMIGYILGLGDRHVQNILMDESTAEVVHIDFGIAFEQGRVQPTPETVPFRLTQDMVAGLGAAGVEGIFTRCCEQTMNVLRSNKDTLLTILEVLLCDPLYMWTISPRQAYSKQNLPVPSTSTEVSSGSGSEAERAILRVSNKLEGTEFGSVLATSGQVARLIQQATDLNNLSRLFPGWQPYL